MKNRVLITGGAGFIGSNLAAHYLKKGWQVTVFDNLSRKGSEKNLSWLIQSFKGNDLKVIEKDVRDFEAVTEAVRLADLIYHLAAQVAVTTSLLNPREDFEVNALGGFNVLEAARQAGHKPIVIYSSTNKVYGQLENVLIKEGEKRYDFEEIEGIDEEHPLDFHSPYGCSKGIGDQYTRDYARIYRLPTVVFRQSCIYGPRQMGVEDQGWVAHFVISALHKRPITIYGNGKQVRDLLHVKDLIAAYEQAVDNIEICRGQVYNIGGGKEFSLSVLEAIELIGSLLGKKIEPSFAEARLGDQKVFISDNTKLKEHLRWEPKVHFKDGITELIACVKENRNLFR